MTITAVFLFIILFLPLAWWVPRAALVCYVIMALLCPVVSFGESILRIELLLCPLLFLIAILRYASANGIRSHSLSAVHYYAFFLLSILLATVAAYRDAKNNFAQGLEHTLPVFYGLLRPLLVMVIFYWAARRISVGSALLWTIALSSIPIGLLSLGQVIGHSIADMITLQWYSSPFRTPIEKSYSAIGHLVRAVGTFESPVYNANYALLALLSSVVLLQSYRASLAHVTVLLVAFVMASVTGVCSGSVTFFLGLPIVVLVLFIFQDRLVSGKSTTLALGSLCVLCTIALIALVQLFSDDRMRDNIDWQLQRIKRGEVLTSRYDPDLGIFASTYSALRERMILGWGLWNVPWAFVGDSVYAIIMYRGGVVAALLFATVILSIGMLAYRMARLPHSSLARALLGATIVLFFTGLGSPSFFTPRILEWYWALVGTVLGTTSLYVARNHETITYDPRASFNTESANRRRRAPGC